MVRTSLLSFQRLFWKCTGKGEKALYWVNKSLYPNLLLVTVNSKDHSFQFQWVKEDLMSTPTLDRIPRYLIGTMKVAQYTPYISWQNLRICVEMTWKQLLKNIQPQSKCFKILNFLIKIFMLMLTAFTDTFSSEINKLVRECHFKGFMEVRWDSYPRYGDNNPTKC